MSVLDDTQVHNCRWSITKQSLPGLFMGACHFKCLKLNLFPKAAKKKMSSHTFFSQKTLSITFTGPQNPHIWAPLTLAWFYFTTRKFTSMPSDPRPAQLPAS